MRLLQAAADPVEHDETVLQVSASIGVTLYPQDGVEADLLMRHADQAMYLAKQAGKNRYHLFDIAHDVASKTLRESLDQVRAGLHRGEFVLFYQPKVNMRTGEVIGAEALIRWQHPERGLLAPGLFLPMIEDTPLSTEMGEWVIATALSQMALWRAQGLEVSVSVNVGAHQLQQGNFTERLAGLLGAQPDIPRYSLELEILETSALQDIAQVSEVMCACQALGVSFALDDFGTGYSSLTYLKRLPAELLKIDQSFVRDMQTDADDLAIVQGVIGLAKAFGRHVIAEGVETVALGGVLLSMGCDLAQGYGIAKPMPAAEIPAWVGHWRADASWTDVVRSR
jgi:EAL domain-containing protein (putative c-di-GMP-specific phosphodiesterase class I)